MPCLRFQWFAFAKPVGFGDEMLMALVLGPVMHEFFCGNQSFRMSKRRGRHYLLRASLLWAAVFCRKIWLDPVSQRFKIVH